MPRNAGAMTLSTIELLERGVSSSSLILRLIVHPEMPSGEVMKDSKVAATILEARKMLKK